MNILYIQHVSVFGGSSRSLYEPISNLPKDVNATVLCPKGEFSDFLESKNIKTLYVKGVPQFDNTRIGFYRKFRWLILLREVYYLPFFILAMFNYRNEKFDLVHVNEVTQVFSLIFGKILLRYVNMLIPIDETVKETLPTSVRSTVIHNGITLKNLQVDKKIDGITGLIIDEKDAEDLVNKIIYLYKNKNQLEQMGLNALNKANENFNSKKNTEQMYQIYQTIQGDR